MDMIVEHVMNEQIECLTEAVYHEARGEPFHGQLLTGFVIKNRVMSDLYPDDFCQVINQPWQFSFVHELEDKTMREKVAKSYSEDIANIVMSSYNPLPEDVLMYHKTTIMPNWDFTKLEEYATIANHIFYVEER